MTAQLTIERREPDDIQDRQIRLWVDGERIENLAYGRTHTQAIAPGHHVVKAHNTLFGTSLEFEASDGEEVRLSCANGMTGGGKLMVLMMGVAYLRVRLERLPSRPVGDVA
jgi:hypothetical protein